MNYITKIYLHIHTIFLKIYFPIVCMGILLIHLEKGYALMPVEVLTDSPFTIVNTILNVEKYMKMIRNGMKTIELQIKNLETLNEKDLYSFLEFTQFQDDALKEILQLIDSNSIIGSFSSGLSKAQENLSQINDMFSEEYINKKEMFEKWIEDFKNGIIKSKIIQKGISDMNTMMSQITETVYASQYFVNNIIKRKRTLENIINNSMFANSPIQQSQLITEVLSLLSSQTEDLIQLRINENIVKANIQQYTDIAQEFLQEKSKQMIQGVSKIPLARPNINYEDDMDFYKKTLRRYLYNE